MTGLFVKFTPAYHRAANENFWRSRLAEGWTKAFGFGMRPPASLDEFMAAVQCKDAETPAAAGHSLVGTKVSLWSLVKRNPEKAFFEITWDADQGQRTFGGPPCADDLRPDVKGGGKKPYTRLRYQPLGGEMLARHVIADNLETLAQRFRIPIVVGYQGRDVEVSSADSSLDIFSKLTRAEMFEDRTENPELARREEIARLNDLFERS